jgi:hypothetical protein
MTSYHPVDIRLGYCGNCHDTTSGEVSVLAMREFARTGEIPEWRKRFLETQAIHEAIENL